MTFYKINGETTTKEVYDYLILATNQNEEQCSKVYKDKHNNTYHNIFMSNKLLMLVLNVSIKQLLNEK
jgi:hypothetical protein